MTNIVNDPLFLEIATYYSNKLALHGDTPRGVDWNGEVSQLVRFDQLSNIINTQDCFSVNDLGCGYGALYDYLSTYTTSFEYSGIDISEDMINAAKMHYGDKKNAQFFVSNKPQQIADYSIASGIFNVRLSQTESKWQSYMKDTLDILDQSSRYGFAFNCLTLYSDLETMKEYLHYANPCELFDFCKRRYSPNVSLLHDYALYEFTILVRKSL